MLKIDMEMPDNCTECNLSKYISPDYVTSEYEKNVEIFFCAINHMPVTGECMKRLKSPNCPLKACDDETPLSNMGQEEDHINPPHYKAGGVECIDLMLRLYGRKAAMEYCKLNGFKYMYRTDRKGGKEDIGKAAWYLKKYLELAEKEPKDDRDCVPRQGDM